MADLTAVRWDIYLVGLLEYSMVVELEMSMVAWSVSYLVEQTAES